jgi:TonB family protein
MRPLLLLLFAAGALAQSHVQDHDELAHKIAARAGHPEARVVTREQELKITAQPRTETIVWCDTTGGQLACGVDVGANGEWRSELFLPDLYGTERGPAEVRWWLPEARSLMPMRVGGDVKAPNRIHMVDPNYTDDARKARVSGVVIAEIIVNESGRVVEAHILKGLPFGLSASAIDAVKQWRFEPGTLQGKPVAVLYAVTVNFHPD